MAYGEGPVKIPCVWGLMDDAEAMAAELAISVSGDAMTERAVRWKQQLLEEYPELNGTELTLDNFRENLERWIEGHEVVS